MIQCGPVVQRFDVGRLGKVDRTTAGAVKIPALVGRTGVQSYTDSDGKLIREYRPPEEVFSEETLKSLDNAPVTVGHPDQMVDSVNWSKFSVGHARSKSESEKVDDHEWMAADLVVNRSDVISQIDSGELSENSLGYKCKLDWTPGVSPQGEVYDCIQRKIRINHNALLPSGSARAGRHATLRLDGSQEPVKSEKVKTMKTIRIDGVELEEGSPSHVQTLHKRIDSAEAENGQLKAKNDEAVKQNAELQAKLDSEKERADKAEQALKPEAVGALVRQELSFRADCSKVLGDGYKFDAKSRHEVRLDVAKELEVKFDEDKSEDYVAAYIKSRLDAVTEDYNEATVKEVEKTDDKPKNDIRSKYAAAFNRGAK